MKNVNLTSLLALLLLLAGNTVFAQVKIGGQKASAPHPSAVLELSDSAKGFLMPRLKQEQMDAIKAPANGLLVYNTSNDKIYVYRQSIHEWKELIMAPLPAANLINPEDSSEWVYDYDSSRVYLRRALLVNDTVFYSPVLGKMIFADKYSYSNSLGQPDFNVDRLGGKWVFKSTASQMVDSLRSTAYTTSIINEVDDAANTFTDFHAGLLVVTTKNPKSTQTSSQISGANINTIHAGQDTTSFLNGLTNTSTINGNGYTETVFGLSNNVRMGTNATNGVGSIFGMRNSISRVPALPGIVDGNIYGYWGAMNGFGTKLTGNMYGIFLNNVTDASPGKNYAIYTNRGLNRFADSMLVTDNFSALPRAVFDINSTSAMIMPNGSTAQRPVSNIQGMLRYNNTTNNPEYNNGTSWLGIGDGGEWKFNSGNNNIELYRPLAMGDSIFYRSDNRHFLFSDRATYTNSLGNDFNSDLLGGKFTFKSTASKTQDSAGLASYTGSFIREIDNSSNTYNDFHSGLLVATTVNPKSFQTSSQVQGLNVSTIHAGQDTTFLLNGLTNSSTINGNGYTETVFGFSNNVRMSTNATNGVGSIFGMRNSISRVPALAGTVDGNIYGYFGSMNGFGGKLTGNMYGIFLGNVIDAAPGKNFALYTNRGVNRFGDSVVITDNFSFQPRAVFDINSTSAMIMPNGTTAQRPVTNVQGMLRYNSTGNNPEFNNGTNWLAINTDSSEWVNFSPRIIMKRAMPLGDSIFYNTQNRHMIFGDRTTYTNSLGSDFSADQLGGKFTFKSTASQMTDSAGTSIYTTSIINEVDNASNTFNDSHSGLLVATTVNPKSIQTSSFVQGANISTIHAGQDTVFQLSGLDNLANVNGNGYTEIAQGISSTVRMSANSRNNVGAMYGMRSNVARLNTATGNVTGNVYGYFGTMSGLAGRVNGTMYGIFLNNISNGTTRRNYGIYTNAGLNRFGDSVLITNTGATLPRAVVDINATSAMIVPTGTTANRPAAGVTGMVRYNSGNGGTLETFNGTEWNGTIRNTQSINVPNIPANSSVSVSVPVTGATVGSVVYTSPSTALTAGIVIAWARVSAANTVEIRFNNVTGANINLPVQNFSIRVIQ
jgi:hypothetical protein